jgi:hypothetical protein
VSVFVVNGRLEMDAAQARKEVQSYSKELTKTGAANDNLTKSSDRTSKSTRGVGTSSNIAERKVVDLRQETIRLANANRIAATTAHGVAKANRAGTAATANLMAQFIDIGVMMAAGLNPLQLAIQQGTQITQVIGPMGAAGAAKSLGGALVSMVNPISLITLGSIAAGAALVQWMASGESADDLTKKIEELETAVSEYNAAADLATATTEELEDRFGSASTGIRMMIADLERIARNDAQQKLEDMNATLSDMMSIGGSGDQRTGIADFFDVNIGLAFTDVQRAARSEARQLTGAFVDQQTALKDAKGDIDAQVETMHNLLLTTESLANASGDVSKEEREILTTMRDRLFMMLELQKAANDVDQFGGGRNAVEPAFARQIAHNEKVRAQKQAEFEKQIAITRAHAETRIQSNRIWAAGQNVIAGLKAQTDMQALIAQHGEQSIRVAEARVQAERDAFVETELTADMSQTLRDMLLDAWDAANGVSSVDMAGNISLAANEAARLAANLALASRGNAILTASRDNADFFDPRNESGLAGNTDANVYNVPLGLPGVTLPPNPKSKSKKKRGGASETEKQRKATQDLIDTLNEELAIIRESDPVRQEMLRNREALAGATAAERAQIEELITVRNRDQRAMEDQQEMWDSFRSVGYDTFQDLINSGGTFNDVLKNLAGSIFDMAQQALLLGEGPLAHIFGGGGSSGGSGGGLFGTILGAIFPKSAMPALAEGGKVYGPGSGTSDDVLMWGSNGEYMVNARATAQHLPLLEAINSGASLPALAKGGSVGGAQETLALMMSGATVAGFGSGAATAPASPAQAARQVMEVNMSVEGARGDKELEEAGYRGMEKALSEYDREVLPRRVSQINKSPRDLG